MVVGCGARNLLSSSRDKASVEIVNVRGFLLATKSFSSVPDFEPRSEEVRTARRCIVRSSFLVTNHNAPSHCERWVG